MSEHTKEPWFVNPVFDDDKAYSGRGYYRYEIDDNGADDEANAYRIKACVNACAGIPTEFLEQAAVNFDLIYLRDCEARADEATRLLERICDENFNRKLPDRHFDLQAAIDDAHRFIEKAQKR